MEIANETIGSNPRSFSFIVRSSAFDQSRKYNGAYWVARRNFHGSSISEISNHFTNICMEYGYLRDVENAPLDIQVKMYDKDFVPTKLAEMTGGHLRDGVTFVDLEADESDVENPDEDVSDDEETEEDRQMIDDTEYPAEVQKSDFSIEIAFFSNIRMLMQMNTLAFDNRNTF